jgi:DNA-binding NarL/FixJ family response regulator
MDLRQSLHLEDIRGVAPLRKWYLASGLETSVIFAMRSRLMLFHFWNMVGASRQKDVLGCFTTGAETLQQLEASRSGILVATQSLEDMGGDDLIQQALLIQPDLATLLFVEDEDLTTQPSRGYRSNVIIATRDLCTPEVEFHTAFFAAIGRAKYRSPSIKPATVNSHGTEHIELTRVERQLLQFYAKGLSVREMAEHLPYTYDTTKTYSRNLLLKLGVNNRQKALVRALEIGLLRR